MDSARIQELKIDLILTIKKKIKTPLDATMVVNEWINKHEDDGQLIPLVLEGLEADGCLYIEEINLSDIVASGSSSMMVYHWRGCPQPEIGQGEPGDGDDKKEPPSNINPVKHIDDWE